MTHAKSPLTPRGRRILVDRILIEGWPVAHAAALTGVSRQTAHKWLKRFADEGAPGLEDRPSRARRCPHRTSSEVEAAVLALRAEIRRGPHRLSNRLGIPASTVHAILQRHGVSRLSRLDRVTGAPIRRERPVRYERSRPGELVHVDVKKIGRVPPGGGWRALGREVANARERRRDPVGYDYLHVAIDDHSRYAYVEVLTNERGDTCAGFFERTREHFSTLGVRVERVMTDNAKNYTLSKLFRAALGDVAHLRTRPYRPQTNGKAERFNRTLADEWAYERPYATNNERTAALAAFLVDYNWQRTHSGIGNRPPASRLP